MICKKCNTENPDNAVFCFACGQRLDGKHTCPKCGNLIPEDFVFCPQCGTKVKTEPTLPEGQHKCVKCETVFEGNFCPKCGTRAQENASPQPTSREKVKIDFNLPKFLNYFGHGAALFVALLSFIFVFLAGLKLTGDDLTNAIIGSLGFTDMTKIDLYYYFGQAYEDIRATLSAAEQYSGLYETSLYLPVIFGTIVSAAMIVTVTVLFILTVIRCVNKLLGKTEKTGYKLATATFFAFLGGLIAFSSLSCAYAKIVYSSSTMATSVTVKTAYNGASIAGIVLGSIFFTFMIAAMLIQRGKELIKVKSIVNLSAGALGIIFLAIVAGMLAAPPAAVSNAESGQLATIKLNFFSFISSFSLNDSSADQDMLGKLLSYASVAQFAIIALTVTTIISMALRFRNITEKRFAASLALSIANTVLAIVLLVFSLLYISNELVTATVAPAEIGVAPVIVALIFAVLDLVLSVAHKILDRAIVVSDAQDTADTSSAAEQVQE